MKDELRIDALLVRQVSELVSATASVATDGDADSSLDMEIHLYRTLAVNCQQKADMSERLRKEAAKRRAQLTTGSRR
jgi:hypothetical protein